ncbi:hypothetical protein ACFSTE_03995 [Aquimarina hainanensis]|uniref:Uncharacterized protein n=1 Tax=Aquimarina hainanensis TaxID=1578017 RepID=A0ABW5N496_9FLAO
MDQLRTTKNNLYILNSFYYIIAVLCVTAFFAYAFFPSQTKDYIEAKSKFDDYKELRTKALSKVKNEAKGTRVYLEYLDAKKEVEKAKQNLLEIKEKDKFFGFDNKQQFFGEFGWIFGFFTYSLFHLIVAILDKSEYKKGKIWLNSTTLFISCYYLGWCFNIKQDFEVYIYVVACLIATGIIVGSLYFALKTKNTLWFKVSSLVSYVLKIRRVYIAGLAVKAMEVEENETIDIVLDFENETKKELEKLVE